MVAIVMRKNMKLGDNTLNDERLTFVNTKISAKILANCSPYADAHANHVELFPAASRWMITCLAAVGCFHDLLIIIEESACGWFASTMSICSSSISVCRKERKTVVVLYLPKKQPTFCISPSKYDVCLGTNANILSKRKVAYNFFKRRRFFVKHWKRLLLFLYCISLLCYEFTSFVNVFPGK